MTFAPSTIAKETQKRDDDLLIVPVLDNVVIYKGSLVVSVGGYASSVYATGATGDVFLGVAEETVDNTVVGHASGFKSIRVYRNGSFKFIKSGGSAVQADVGAAAYTDVSAAGGANYITLTNATHDSYVGIITECVDSTYLRVSIKTNDILNIAA